METGLDLRPGMVFQDVDHAWCESGNNCKTVHVAILLSAATGFPVCGKVVAYDGEPINNYEIQTVDISDKEGSSEFWTVGYSWLVEGVGLWGFRRMLFAQEEIEKMKHIGSITDLLNKYCEKCHKYKLTARRIAGGFCECN